MLELSEPEVHAKLLGDLSVVIEPIDRLQF